MSYKMIYIPSCKYGLPACTLSLENIDYIQKYTVDKFVSAIGFEHTLPRAIVFGPKDYGGLELPHLYTEMMSNKLEIIIAHLRADTPLGKAIMININHLQLTAGTETSLFESRDDLKYIDMNWLLHLREYMIEINASFEFPNIWKIKKQRENDRFLMDEYIKRGLSSRELRLVNNWRIYFQVNTLVDICDPSDTKIEQCFLKKPNGIKPLKSNQSILNWPVQQEPGKIGFALWIKCLKECFNMQKSGGINHRFGPWIPEHYHSQNVSNAYYQPSTGLAYETDLYHTMVFTPLASRSASIICNRSDSQLAETIPKDCIRATMQKLNDINIFKYSKLSTVPMKKKSTPNIINDYSHLAKWKSSILEHLHILNNEQTSALYMNDKQHFCIVSDGGVYDSKGTFGVLISDGHDILASNKGMIYSVDYLESPFRSEMYAVLSGLVMFQTLIQNTSNDKEATVNLYSDNKAAIKRINDRRWRRRTVNQYRGSDVDIELQVLEEICHLEQQKFRITLKYVRSHQDLKKSKNAVNHEEKMNVLADQLTKEARLLQDKTEYHPLPTNNVNLIINNEYINSKYSQVTRKAYDSIELRQYFQQRHKWNNKTVDSIWWKAFFKSFDKMFTPDQDRILKFIHDKMPTNKRDHMKYDFKTPFCKQCLLDEEETIEDEDHMLLCPSA